jgi:hypothetical protein
MIDLRFGDFREVLRDVECGAIITDPPFSERTHKGHDRVREMRGDEYRRKGLSFASWSPKRAREFASWCVERSNGWIVILT